jgi:hypothetical protein
MGAQGARHWNRSWKVRERTRLPVQCPLRGVIITVVNNHTFGNREYR